MKLKNDTIAFYNQLIKVPFLVDGREIIKREFFAKVLTDNLLYKYISFDDDEILNEKKLNALRNRKLWYAAHYTLRANDPSEFQVNANVVRVMKATNKTMQEVLVLLKAFRELNDVCCLTDSIREYMWQRYANNHSGCCCVFKIIKTEMLMPVIYCDKKNTDFTNDLILSIKNGVKDNIHTRKIAFIPNVLKDKIHYGKEQEIRLLCGDIYDDEKDEMGGRVAPEKKEMLRYKGVYYSYEKSGLELEKIIVGNRLKKEIVKEIKRICPKMEIE